MQRLDWFDLRNIILVARTVTEAALRRTESRGAHQREDFPEMLPQWRVNQTIRLRGNSLDIAQTPSEEIEVAAQ
jgi:succinate dehydrogenase/fumarate reductase flavoprotein subunit